jgi:Ca-activated chloride channel family protein
LKQIAARLGGTYHDGNAFHLASGLIAEAMGREEEDIFERLTRREYALIASALGASILALLPLLLHLLGTKWRPGTSVRPALGAGVRRGPVKAGNQRAPVTIG